MENKISSEQLMEHAWKYFEIHSNQRITLFNYFLFIMTGLGAAIGITLQASSKFAYVGIFLSFFVSLVSFVFWKLDQRTSFLIKESEKTLILLERNSAVDFAIFSKEEANLDKHNKDKFYIFKTFTYGNIFRLVFFTTGLVGVLGMVIFILKIFAYISLK